MPLPIDAFQLLRSEVIEHGARADHKALCRAGCEDLGGSGKRHDPSRDVNSDAAESAVDLLAFPGVNANTNVEAKLLNGACDRRRAAQSVQRLRE